MSLLEQFKETYVIMEKTRIPDGEGGLITRWNDGAEIDLALRFDTTMEARKAAHDGVTSVYTFFAPRDCVLEYHDVVKRKRDGQIFRMTSNAKESETPGSATISLTTITAEKWVLPS